MPFAGFLIVAACVMTFEARDNAAKVVPSSGWSEGAEERKSARKLKAVKFRSSASQTTFLDRNIVRTLNVPTGAGAAKLNSSGAAGATANGGDALGS